MHSESVCQPLCSRLLSPGLLRRDRIGIWAPNRPEWLIAQCATAHIGLILDNLSPAFRVSELEYALNKVGAIADGGDCAGGTAGPAIRLR